MPYLNIKVNRINDKEPAWPDIQKCTELSLERAAILEKGMASGKTSVTFALQDSSGNYFAAQTSVAILETLLGAIKGAEANWNENPV
jgi:hypothetical protein